MSESTSRTSSPPSLSPAGAANAPRKESIKETIEAILVAFILAFVFRAFIVEAFVIPSGSMATTLLGGHMRFDCEECGYRFDVNYPASSSGDDLNIPSQAPAVFSMHCPNCGFKVQRDNTDPRLATPLPVHYGDRILVLKYLYLLQDPARWDVVVFKSPYKQEYYTQNYIKRLVGLPGESVMILDGDVYVNSRHQPGDNPDGWTVQPKPKKVQDALWRVIHDNDFYPRQRARNWNFPWKQTEGSGWKDISNPGRILSFENPTGGGRLWFDRNANSGTFPFTDWLPYAETAEYPRSNPPTDAFNINAYESNLIPRWHVSDLRLCFSYLRRSGDGALRASLKKLDDTFTLEILPDVARVIHQRGDGQLQAIGQAPLPGSRALPLVVEFQNVDYQVTLRLNGQTVIQSNPRQYQPDIPRLLSLYRQEAFLASHRPQGEAVRKLVEPSVEIYAEKQSSAISHLSLWRDIYYTPKLGRSGDLFHGSPERPAYLAGKNSGKELEYFVLGDNSVMSGDARSWISDVDLTRSENLFVESGRVPQRFMLGKAFFVYWPAGYRPFTRNAPGIIPNFGDMRFIH